jgi:hypothetical protein
MNEEDEECIKNSGKYSSECSSEVDCASVLVKFCASVLLKYIVRVFC